MTPPPWTEVWPGPVGAPRQAPNRRLPRRIGARPGPGVGVLVFLSLTSLSLRNAQARHTCHEVSDIVGEQKCSRFGQTWNSAGLSYITASAGLSIHVVPLQPLSFSRLYRGISPLAIPVATQLPAISGADFGPQRHVGASADFRLTWALKRWFYLGTEGEFGGGGLPETDYHSSATALGPVDQSITGFYYLAGGLLIGASLPLGPLALRGEVLLGGREIGLIDGSAPPPGNSTASGFIDLSSTRQWLVEPRLLIDVWVQPWVTLGARVGVDLVNGYAVNVGLVLTRHARSYGAAPPRR